MNLHKDTWHKKYSEVECQFLVKSFLPAAKRQVKCWCRFIIFARRRLLLLFCYFCLCAWSLEYFQLVPLYGCLWTCLDPSNHIWDNLDPGAKFWVQGLFGPKFKNCNFLTKPHKMGVYEITWTPSNHFRVIWTLGPTFGSTGPLPSFGISVVQFFDLNCRPTSHLPLTWATTKVDTIMSSW